MLRIRSKFPILLLMFLLFLSSSASSATNLNPRTIRVAVYPHTPPFQFLDEDFKLTGFHVDIMNQLAEDNNFVIVYSTYNTKSECINALDRNVVDVILGYQVLPYENTTHMVTSELSSASLGIVAEKSLADHIDKTGQVNALSITFEYGAVDYSLLHALGFQRLLGVGNQEQAAEKLITNNTDTMVGIQESIDYMLAQKGAVREYQTIHSSLDTVQFSMLVNKNDPALFRQLDQAITDLHASSTYEDFRDHWIQDRGELTLRRYLSILAFFAIAVLLIAAVVGWFNHLLRQKVAAKTQELSDANHSLERTVSKLENEALFRNQMLQSLPVSAVFFDPHYSVLLMNQQAAAICGHSVNTDPPDIRTLPVFGEILSQLSGEIFSPGTRVEQLQVFNINHGDSMQQFRCWCHRLIDEDHYSGALMMVENITQEVRHRNEQFAIEKANTINQVVAGIAHEIKNPLMIIKTAVSLMSTQWENPSVKDAFIQFIPGEVERMNDLVRSLMNYAKPPNEKFSIFPLAELLRNSFSLARIADNKLGIRFELALDESLHIRGQRDLLRQVLTNLLLNSIWALQKRQENQETGWSPQITGRLYSEEHWICLSLWDNGVGMPQAVVDHCAEPFYTTKIAGTGLGLALAKQCVENAGGTLTIHSEDTQYTQVELRFPIDLTPKEDNHEA